MKKYAIGMLIISILITASLTACNNPESTKEIITTNHAGDTEPSEVVRTENSVEPNYSKKIDLALKENHQIHVQHIRLVLKSLKESGATILLASHFKEDIDFLCDEVYQMDCGVLTHLQ